MLRLCDPDPTLPQLPHCPKSDMQHTMHAMANTPGPEKDIHNANDPTTQDCERDLFDSDTGNTTMGHTNDTHNSTEEDTNNSTEEDTDDAVVTGASGARDDTHSVVQANEIGDLENNLDSSIHTENADIHMGLVQTSTEVANTLQRHETEHHQDNECKVGPSSPLCPKGAIKGVSGTTCPVSTMQTICEKNRIVALKLHTILDIMHNQGLCDGKGAAHAESGAGNHTGAAIHDYTAECVDATQRIYVALLRLILTRKQNRAAKNRKKRDELLHTMSREANVASHVQAIVDSYEQRKICRDSQDKSLHPITEKNHQLFSHIYEYERLQRHI